MGSTTKVLVRTRTFIKNTIENNSFLLDFLQIYLRNKTIFFKTKKIQKTKKTQK